MTNKASDKRITRDWLPFESLDYVFALFLLPHTLSSLEIADVIKSLRDV